MSRRCGFWCYAVCIVLAGLAGQYFFLASSSSNEDVSQCPYAGRPHRADGSITSSVVARHAAFFANINGSLTHACMRHGHHVQGIRQGVDVKMRAILNLLSDRNIEPTAENVATIVNPEATGLWDRAGHFDPSQFDKLRKMCILDNGKEIFTKQVFNDFRQQRIHHANHNNTGTATYVFYVVPVSWKLVTDGSIDELFDYYSDHWYKNAKGEYEKALSVARAKSFYMDPTLEMERRIGGSVLVLRPEK